MMRLSTKGRYGARVMLELALNYGNGPVLLKDIAKHQGISVGYLEHILPRLKAAGLVNSTRGAHGGYTLAKEPSRINLGQVVKALEGNLAIVECVTAPQVCQRVESCITRDIWGQMSRELMKMLGSTTLQDMVNRQKKKQESSPLMYSI
ncbi:MAG: Rrf2 family transcriptional regulator [Deltaproteobacteria bacterium]|nr:Rrf2 family transcriptional regulator [Deltaproteobacteria bacterium]